MFLILLSSSCLATTADKKKNSTVNELQLQEDIQRFYTRFTERIIETTVREELLFHEHKQDTLRQYLLYDSEALKITTAPFPVVNLLDMLVFVKLSRIVIEDYWIPKVYERSGKNLLGAFKESEKDIERIASKVMTPDQLARLNRFIINWRLEHPDQVRVEKVRMSDFAKFVRGKEKTEKSFMLVDTQSAVQAVDQMVLVANRGIFLAQQLPLIARLHTRLGTQEILSDTISTLQSAPKIINEINSTNGLVENLKELIHGMDVLTKDTQSLLTIVSKQFEGKIDINYLFYQINSMLDKTSIIIKQINKQQPLDQKILHQLKGELQNLVWFLAFVTLLVFACISTIWWTGSYISKKHFLEFTKRTQQKNFS